MENYIASRNLTHDRIDKLLCKLLEWQMGSLQYFWWPTVRQFDSCLILNTVFYYRDMAKLDSTRISQKDFSEMKSGFKSLCPDQLGDS